MRKICFLLVLVLLLGLCACGGKGGAFSEADLSLTVEGNSVTAKSSVEDILAALGDGYVYSEAISCVYEGMDKTYEYENVTLYTYPDGDSDRLMELYCVGGNVATSKGITFGSTKAEVLAQYGDGCVETGSMLSYELPVSGSDNLPASLYFMLKDGKVSAIAITAEHRAE